MHYNKFVLGGCKNVVRVFWLVSRVLLGYVRWLIACFRGVLGVLRVFCGVPRMLLGVLVVARVC